MTERTKLWLFPFVLAFVAALSMTFFDDGFVLGFKTRAMGRLVGLLRDSLGIGGTVLMAFGLGAILSLLASMVGQDEPRLPGVDAPLLPGPLTAIPKVPVPLPTVAPQAGGFGRRAALAPPSAPLRSGQHRRMDSAASALDNLATRGFDWYFAHYGDEGNWRNVERDLIAHGEHERAAIMRQAGSHFEQYMNDFAFQGIDPSPEQQSAYFDRSRAYEKAWRAARGPGG